MCPYVTSIQPLTVFCAPHVREILVVCEAAEYAPSPSKLEVGILKQLGSSARPSLGVRGSVCSICSTPLGLRLGPCIFRIDPRLNTCEVVFLKVRWLGSHRAWLLLEILDPVQSLVHLQRVPDPALVVRVVEVLRTQLPGLSEDALLLFCDISLEPLPDQLGQNATLPSECAY